MSNDGQTTNRWHNILGSLADWQKIKADFEDMHKRAEDAGLELKIIDDSCPYCGFRPVVRMDERKEKKQGRPKRQPKQLPLL
jgi:hypothetical protein